MIGSTVGVSRSGSLSRPLQGERSKCDIKSAQEEIVPGLWIPSVLGVWRAEFMACKQ